MRSDAIATGLGAVRPDRVVAPVSRAGSCGLLRQLADPDEVVDRRGEGVHPIDPGRPTMPELPHQADRLEPAEDLLDELAFPLAHQVAGMARGAAIDRTRTIRRVLGHVR